MSTTVASRLHPWARHAAGSPARSIARAAAALPGARRSKRLRWRGALLLAWLGACLSLGAAPDAASSFDAANKLYEQGRFSEAAASYANLVRDGQAAPVVWLNLGNAWFKAGQLGRAIAAYRQGLRLAPRDPSLLFNLQFARKRVTGNETPPGRWWERWLASLTVGEWTVLCVIPYWLWMVMLGLGEWRASWRRALRGYAASAGVATLLMAGCLAGALMLGRAKVEAVVCVRDAVVRNGPLEESQVRFQLNDGAEVTVLDEKPGPVVWLLVRDATGREGWVKRDAVLLVRRMAEPSTTGEIGS